MENKLNLQLFAEGGENVDTGTTNEGATDTTEETKEELTLEQVQKMIQSETDKVRTEYSKKLKALEREKEELEKAKMTEEEKAKYELEKYQKELAEKEKAIALKELTIITGDLLKENGLPFEFRDFLIGTDEEDTKLKISLFKKEWDKAIKAEVEGRFKASGREINKGSKVTMTREEIMKIKDPSQRIRAIRENQDLFK